MIATAPKVVHRDADQMEMALSTAAFLKDTVPQLAGAIEQDRTNYLDQKADNITSAIEDNRQPDEWPNLKRILAFGGRPPRVVAERPYVCDKDGNPIASAEEQAETELDHFAQPEHSRIRNPNDICQDCNRHAYEAILMRTVLPTPIDNVITKPECRKLFAKARAN